MEDMGLKYIIEAVAVAGVIALALTAFFVVRRKKG
jgi:LPXTG-motif cell wall-anchored protein